jgi:NDP-sugar pyrophosphorylase family protein
MAIYRNQGRWDASNVISDGSWVTCYAKGASDPRFDHIDYGATALRRDVIAALPADERIGLGEIQSQLAAAGRLRSVVARDRFFEIGSPGGLAELDQYLRASS